MNRPLALGLVSLSAGLLLGSGPAPTPPVAPRKDHAQVWHGRTFADPYFWLREKGSPDVVAYLEAENAYTEATTADLQAFSKALYEEMLARIKQTDLSVPVREGRFHYYRRTVEGQQYPIRCRKPAAPDGALLGSAPEEVLLDQNEMAKGLAFLSVGVFAVSDDDARLLYSTDTTGFRQYKLFVKDLRTGRVQGPLAERVTSAAWTADDDAYTEATDRTEAVQRGALHGDAGHDRSCPPRAFSTAARWKASVPIRCRKPAGPDGAWLESAPEEVLLDQNEMAKGLPFLSVGAFEVSDDDARLLYSSDETGFRQYRLFVKDLKTGAVQGPLAERVTSATWAADSRTVFYVTEHPVTKRPDTLWRLKLGGQPEKVYEEKDELFSIGVGRTKDKKFVVLGCGSTDTWDRRLLPASTPGGELRLVLPREKGHKYDVEHRDGTLFIRTNKDAKNFRLVTAPLADPSPAALEDVRRAPAGRAPRRRRGLQGLRRGPGEAGRAQPPARARLLRRQLEGGLLPRARLHRLRVRHAGVRLEGGFATATRA